MVIATNLIEQDALILADICDKAQKPFMNVYSKGLAGVFRIQSSEHTIVETHPENSVDLRLGCPFPELSNYVKAIDLDSMDQTDHSHVPFVVVLLKYIQTWEQAHDGACPTSYDDRNELKKLLREGMRTPDEENFEEAIANVWRLSSSDTVKKNTSLFVMII